MGDFDRHAGASSAKPNETRKLVFVIALGAVLVGLVAMQMIKKGGGPQTVVGAPPVNSEAVPSAVSSDQISPQSLAGMMAQLQSDPTKSLLQGDAQDSHAPDIVPRNPFTMSGDWLKSLIHSAAVPGATQPAPIRVTPTVNVPQPLAPRAEDFKLSSIVNGDMAIINGRVVRVGDIVNRARVIQIRDDAVVLQAADAPGGPVTEISTAPRVNRDN